LDSHVIVGDDGFHLGTGVLGGHLGGHLEIHDIAGIVLDDVQHASAAVDEPGGLMHLVRCRRGEHLTGAGRVEHPRTDETTMQRLVPRPAAGDETNLAGDRCVGTVDHLTFVIDPQLWVGCCDSGQRVGHHGRRVVDELLHC
jgi:hypothetical protein